MATDGSVTAFAAPQETGSPSGIALGPDNNVWFGDPSKHALFSVAPDGDMTRFPVGSDKPRDIVSGPGGDLWFTTEGDGRRIGRMTTAGVVTDYGDDITSQPVDLTVGPDGNIWFAESADKVGRITPEGHATEFSLGGPTKPTGIATGPDGALWVTGKDSDGVIVRVDPLTGNATRFETGFSEHAEPSAIAAGPDGNLYFTDRGNGQIGQVKVDGTITESSVPSPKAKLLDITSAPDGNLWFTETNETGDAIGRLTPEEPTAPLDATGAVPDLTQSGVAGPVVGAALGSSVLAAPTAGVVRVRMPGAKKTITLTGTSVIPFGAAIDTTDGRLIFASALPGGGSQAAEMWNGRVRLSQGKDGRVEVYLAGKRPRCHARRTKAAASKNGTSNLVWMRDKHGKFRSHGKNSVATVRGTTWGVAETCAGTLTTVKEGEVAVRDLRRHRTVIVKAGHSYLAKKARRR
jgi:streptogramin lyase